MRLPGFSIAAIVAVTIGLAGCATPGAAEPVDDRLSIVASTNVYGDIAETIAGEFASVTSIITSSAQDPHSYEASARDQLALSKADLVIQNGGGYDPFIGRLLEASDSQPVVIDAVEASGLDAADNEHVWYSLAGMEALAAELARQLGSLDPANAAAYEANHDEFALQLQDLGTEAEALRPVVAGTDVLATEPLPLHLFDELGVENLTPAAFSEGVEEGAGVPPLVLQEVLALIADGSVGLVAYNVQAAGPETGQVLQAADDAGVAAVSFSETLPEGSDYVSWMSDNLAAISSALE